MTVVVAVVVPQLFVAVSDRLMTVLTPTSGAVKTGAAVVRLERLPDAGAAHKNVGTLPVLLPARATVPPDATRYGPPAFACGGAVQTGGGTMLLGHGSSCPASRPLKDV